ncbi:Outer membrane channel TolC (OpmH) [hydrothermal vent metagenome]|uniref:Outer membrane channel TolC (OpmH) n=1 Tax=hydrothermal vent metagenome TaxID=652676 RepID=A0A3B0ZHG6_9ZZZZ
MRYQSAYLYIVVLPLALFSYTVAADNLLDVFQAAKTGDPILQASLAAQNAAEQRHKQSRAQLFFQADIRGNFTETRRKIGDNVTNSDSSGYTLSLSQPVYHHNIYKLLEQTNAQWAQATADYQAAQQNLVTRIAERYFNVLAAQDNLDFSIAEKESNARQLEQTQQRFEVGLIAITDVHEAKAAYDLSIANEISAENALANSKEALRELTGQYHPDLAKLQDEFELLQPEPQDRQAWVDTALNKNFRVLSAQSAANAARHSVKREKAGHYPVLDLVASHSFTEGGGGNTFFFGNQDTTTNSISLELSLPLFRGGGTRAKIKESEHVYTQTRAVLEQTRRTIQREASEAYFNVRSKISEVNAFRQGIFSTQSALEASEVGLEVGTRTTVDVLNTRRELFRAQRDHARARYDYLLSTLQLKEAAGTLSVDDVEKVSQYLMSVP